MPVSQVISAYDLIFISDAGTMFVVRTQDVNGDHQPYAIEQLEPAFQPVPKLLRDQGATLAIMPDAPAQQGGCTCVLINMQSIKDSIVPDNPNLPAAARALEVLAGGGSVTLIQKGSKNFETIRGVVNVPTPPTAKAKSKAKRLKSKAKRPKSKRVPARKAK